MCDIASVDYNNRCYECTGYGDNYYVDPDTGEFVSACIDCPYALWGNDED